jgi:hypothetical protein
MASPRCSYDQCFDRWYKDVFLQQKAHGTVGCQDEYKAYSQCFLVRVAPSAHEYPYVYDR